MEGEGATKIGGQTLPWSAGDVFVAPSWVACMHAARTDAVLFSVSDRPVQEVLGLWREARVQPVE
jgi:gentisate 1,2-dioxygenase